jgi:membrane protease YdiL (CAAX protease family)
VILAGVICESSNALPEITESSGGAEAMDFQGEVNTPFESGTPVQTTEAPRIRRIFFGKSGLRAGWRALLFLMLFVLITFLLIFMLRPFVHLHHGDVPPWFPIVQDGPQVFALVLAAYILSRIERRPMPTAGLAGRSRALRFMAGAVWGIVALSVLVLALDKLHLLTMAPPAIHGSVALGYAGVYAIGFLLVAIFEELLFRGYLQSILSRGIGFWWTALLLCVAFGAVHTGNKGESPLGLFNAAGVALLFCVSLWFTGSLWWAIGFHATWDWGESFLYGTPDSGMIMRGHYFTSQARGPLLESGGPTGPEGSIYALVLLICLILVAYLWWRWRGPAEWPQQHPVPEEMA